MRENTQKLYGWATHKALSTKAPFWLGLLFFLELLLFFPLDALMIFFCSQKKANIFLYILIATIASTLSGMIGYVLGHFLWDLVGPYIVPHIISSASFERVFSHMHEYGFWAVFFGALLPFPLKLLSVVAGVFQLGLFPFIGYLVLARFLRFSFIGILMAFWGEQVKNFFDRHFHRLFVLLGAKIAGALLFLWAVAQ